jgi:hypothetical protein
LIMKSCFKKILKLKSNKVLCQAVVAERSRRLIRNQIPSGSIG